jgi:hypothetical protein
MKRADRKRVKLLKSQLDDIQAFLKEWRKEIRERCSRPERSYELKWEFTRKLPMPEVLQSQILNFSSSHRPPEGRYKPEDFKM